MSRATIICRAQADLGSQWLTVTGAPGAWRIVAASNHLESLITSIKEELAHDWTFTDRAVEDAIATYADSPHQMAGLGLNSHAVIMCPEGPPIENRWASLHRVPVTGSIVVAGLEGRFRPQVIKERVLEWFARQQWRSFQAPRIQERHEPIHMQPQRPTHHRELLVRHSWVAREIAPAAFASTEALARQEAQRIAARATHDERLRASNPRRKGLAMRAAWAAEREARQRDPVAAEKARKARYGLDWGSPPQAFQLSAGSGST